MPLTWIWSASHIFRAPEQRAAIHSAIDVGTLSADVVKLGPELAGQTAILQVHGNFHLRSATDMIIDAAAQRMNGEGIMN